MSEMSQNIGFVVGFEDVPEFLAGDMGSVRQLNLCHESEAAFAEIANVSHD